MTISWLRRRIQSGSDRGNAMLIALMVTVVLTVLGTTGGVLAANNLHNAGTDRGSGTALQVSEGGVTQAIEWLRFWGPNSIACSPTCAAGTYKDWGDGPTSPSDASFGHTVTMAGGRQYVVWIEKVSSFLPPATKTGLYTVHSVGKAQATSVSTGRRAISVDVTIKPFDFPIGVFARTVNAGGNGGIHTESLFSSNCIAGRSKITFNGTDAYYGVPAAAHSANYIGEKQNYNCTAGDGIHAGGVCNASYPNDTDLGGGVLSAAANPACYRNPGGTGTLNGSPWLTTSKETTFQAMGDTYGFSISNPNGLSNSQLDELRTAAQQQGFYFTNTTAIPAVLNAANAWQTYPHPILFYDLKGAAIGGEVDLNGLGGYSRAFPLAANDAGCTPYSAIVIVLNGNVQLNSNTVLAASVVAPGPSPNGRVQKANGGSQLIGTLYADNVDIRGTADVHLDQCFLANMTSTWTITQSNFREEDR